MTEVPTEERIPYGAVVRVINDDPEFDAIMGHEYLVDAYVTAEEGDCDPPQPYYALEPLPGSGYGGQFYAGVSDVQVIRTPTQQAELMKMPEPAELMSFIQDGLHSAWGGDLEIFESRIVGKELELYETEHGYKHGVEFAGRRRDGVHFAGTLRLTSLYRADP